MKEISYGVRDLQAHLGRALRAVERGDRVVITSHGRPIATLSRPVEPSEDLSPEERKLRRMAAEGKIVLGKPGRIPDYKVSRISGLTRQLQADRR
jgi:prevent-host-death family protein